MHGSLPTEIIDPMSKKKEFSEAVDHINEIYPNIAVLAQLSTLLKEPDTDLEDVARLIRSEAALTADVIKVSNSSFYGSTVPCSNIEDALARIGFSEVLKVVALILAKELTSNDLEKYGMSADDFWRESLTVSLLMEELAAIIRLNKAEAATLGIMHNIGRVIINNILELFRIDLYWDVSIPVVGWERTVVGFHYGEAGGRFLKRMKFPPETQEAIQYHVEPESAPEEDRLTYLLHYCVELSKRLGKGFANFESSITDTPTPSMLDLSEDDIGAAIKNAADRFNQLDKEVFSQ